MAEELCHQVKELQEEMDRPRRIWANEQDTDRLFSEMLQSQDSWESQISIIEEKQMDSEPWRTQS